MPRILAKTEFTPEHLRALTHFECGQEPWAIDATRWIKAIGTDNVLDAVGQNTQVWLYGTNDDGLVGFASLAPSRWRWRTAKDQHVMISLIPMLGIDHRFRGQPDGPDAHRFSDQILDDLIHEATSHPDRAPLLGLFVDPRNEAAIRVYRRAGFSRFYRTYPNASGPDYVSMLLDLPPRGDNPADVNAGVE